MTAAALPTTLNLLVTAAEMRLRLTRENTDSTPPPPAPSNDPRPAATTERHPVMIENQTASTSRTQYRSDTRMLATAEGVLVALRRCTVDHAFLEIATTARRHHVAPVQIATALVTLAEGSDIPTDLIEIARREWKPLFDRAPHTGPDPC